MKPEVTRRAFLDAMQRGDAGTITTYLMQWDRASDVTSELDAGDFRAGLAWLLPNHRNHLLEDTSQVIGMVVAWGYGDVLEWLFSGDTVAVIGLEPLALSFWPACLHALFHNALGLLELMLISEMFTECISAEKRQNLLDRLLSTISERQSADAVRLLVAHGASVNKPLRRVKPDMFMLSKSAVTNDYALFKAIVRDGADTLGVQVFESVWTHPEATLRVLLAMEAQGESSKPCLSPHRAASQGRVLAMKLWLEVGRQDVDACDVHGLTPLMHVTWAPSGAAGGDPLAVTELLLDYGVRVDAQDRDGKTPLRHAINSKYPAIVRRLLERGADPNQPTEGGHVVLDFLELDRISENRIVAQLEALLEYGANPYAKGRSGLSALDRLEQTEAGSKFVETHPRWFSQSRPVMRHV